MSLSQSTATNAAIARSIVCKNLFLNKHTHTNKCTHIYTHYNKHLKRFFFFFNFYFVRNNKQKNNKMRTYANTNNLVSCSLSQVLLFNQTVVFLVVLLRCFAYINTHTHTHRTRELNKTRA